MHSANCFYCSIFFDGISFLVLFFEVFFVVAVVAQVLKVIPIETHIRIQNVVWCKVAFVVNDVTRNNLPFS